MKIILYPTSST